MVDRLMNAMKGQMRGPGRLTGQAKFATVSSVDYDTGNIRALLQPDGVLTGWLPVLSTWVGNGWGMSCPPSPGDQVLVIAHEGDPEQGVVVGRSYSRAQKPPAAPESEMWLVHKSGCSLKLCRDGTVRISGDLRVDGDVYDRHGALSALRAIYNDHHHTDSRGGSTSPPATQD